MEQLDSVEVVPSCTDKYDQNMSLSPDEIQNLTVHGILVPNGSGQLDSSEPLDMRRVRENMTELESMSESDPSLRIPSLQSLRNSGPDPEITEITNRRAEM